MSRITAESLHRDRERRQTERAALAAAYDAAAKVLEDAGDHRDAIQLLRGQAEFWREDGHDSWARRG